MTSPTDQGSAPPPQSLADYTPPAANASLERVLRYAALAWRESLTVHRKHMPTPEMLEAAADEIERLRARPIP